MQQQTDRPRYSKDVQKMSMWAAPFTFIWASQVPRSNIVNFGGDGRYFAAENVRATLRDAGAREEEQAVQIWGYCAGCNDWFVCVRGVDGVVASWTCPVCGLQPVSIEQWDCTEEEHPRLHHASSRSAHG